jgi:ubiquinone/menaquinone biosynthesis C-methylase UbiE
MNDFSNATEITMTAYQQIASNYGLSKECARQQQESLTDFWRERLQRFIAVVHANSAYQARPDLPVADVGCGPGREALFLARHGCFVLAIDLSEAMLEQARERTQGQPGAERITFLQMDMRALHLPDASCAGLLASASFLHIPKRENLAVLREFRRVLIPEAPVQLMVKEHDGGADERYDLHEETGMRRFYARYRGGELWNLLEEAEFQVLEITTTIDTRFPNQPRWLAALAISRR